MLARMANELFEKYVSHKQIIKGTESSWWCVATRKIIPAVSLEEHMTTCPANCPTTPPAQGNERWQATAGTCRYEIRLVQGLYEWSVFEEGTLKYQGKDAHTFDEAVKQIVTCTAQNPDGDWIEVKQ